MRPQAISQNPPKAAVAHFKMRGAFFDQDAAGQIVSSERVARSGIFNRGSRNFDIRGPAYQDWKPGDICEVNVRYFDVADAIQQKSVIQIPDAKRIFGRRHRQRLRDGRAVSVETEIVEANTANAFAHEKRSAFEIRAGFEHSIRSDDFKIVSLRRDLQFVRKLNFTRR